MVTPPLDSHLILFYLHAAARARKITGQEDDRSLEFYLNLYKFTGIQEIIDNKTTDENGRIYHPKVFGIYLQ